MEILSTPAPKPRERKSRLTDEIRNLKPGQSVIVDPKTARCAVAHIKYSGGVAVQQKKADGKIQVWMIE